MGPDRAGVLRAEETILFNMLALLPEDAPDVSIDTLADKVQARFGGDAAFRLEYEVLPFNTERNLMLRWQGWSARLIRETAEDDEQVADDSAEIARILGAAAPAGIADCTRRIRAVFHDDPDEQYIDEMVEIMALLEGLEGAVVFDPQQNKLMD